MADDNILSLKKFDGGLITRVEDTDIPDSAFSDCENIELDEKFVPTKSKGHQKYNSTGISANPIKGAGKYVMSDGTSYYIAACGGKLYYSIVGSGTWTAYKISGVDLTIDATSDVEMVQYQNSMWIVNGNYPVITNSGYGTTKIIKITGTKVDDEISGTADSGTSVTLVDNALTQADDYWKGGFLVVTNGAHAGEVRPITGFVASTDTVTVSPAFTDAITNTTTYLIYKKVGDTNTPSGGKYIIVHMERIFIASSTDQVNGMYWSEPYEPENWTPEYGLNFDYIGRDDGENITGIKSYQGYVYVGKPHNIYRYSTQGDITEWQSMRVDTNHGWLYNRTIQEFNGQLIYLSGDGVVMLNGNNAVLVSEQIRDKILELPQGVSNVHQWLMSTTTEFDTGIFGNLIDTADNQLTLKAQLPTSAWTAESDLPFNMTTSGCVCAKDSDTFYVLCGIYFYKFVISTGIWTALTPPPSEALDGAAMIAVSSNIYVIRGGNTPTFWRYNYSSWFALADSPYNNGVGASLSNIGNYFYCVHGGNSNKFSKYGHTLPNPNDAWSSSTVVPVNVGAGGCSARVYIDTVPYILLLIGGGSKSVYAFNGNSLEWASKANSPYSVYAGTSITVSSTYICYVLFGGISSFQSYTLATDTWSSVPNLPVSAGAGSSLVTGQISGVDYIYALMGGNSKSIYRWLVTAIWLPQTLDFGFTPSAFGHIAANITGTITFQSKSSATDLSEENWNLVEGWSTPAQANNSQITSTVQRYLRVKINLGEGGIFASLYMGANYRSPHKDLGSIPTSWGKYESAQALNGQTITHWFRSAASDGALDAATWYQQTPGTIITGAAVGQHIQFEVRFDTVLYTQQPVVESVKIEYYTGASMGQPCSVVWRNNYWLNVAKPGSSTNDTVYMYNSGGYWLKRTNKNNNIYFIDGNYLLSGTSASDGFLRYNDTGTKDDTTDITSYFITRNFELMPFIKLFRTLLVTSKSNAAWTLSYSVDNGTYVDVTMSLQGFVSTVRKVFVDIVRGRFIKFKVTSAVEDGIWEFHGLQMEYRSVRKLNIDAN